MDDALSLLADESRIPPSSLSGPARALFFAVDISSYNVLLPFSLYGLVQQFVPIVATTRFATEFTDEPLHGCFIHSEGRASR